MQKAIAWVIVGAIAYVGISYGWQAGFFALVILGNLLWIVPTLGEMLYNLFGPRSTSVSVTIYNQEEDEPRQNPDPTIPDDKYPDVVIPIDKFRRVK